MTSFWWIALPAQASPQPSPLIQLLPMVLILVVFYLVWFLPVQRKQKAHQQMLAELKKGDRVLTNGGLFGKIVKVDEQIVVLEIAENTRVRLARQAISGLESDDRTQDGSK